MRVGSLFTGYGGLDMAVGGDLAWYAEVEPAACKVLAAHYPGVPNLGDITQVDWSAVEPVDVITGGYPCQPFSNAGKRKGKDDERHLWPYVRDAIGAIRPRWAVLENVRGHLSLGFADVLADLADLGVSARWGVVRAADAGAPHNRARLFIVADTDGERHERAWIAWDGRARLAHGDNDAADAEGTKRRGAKPDDGRESESGLAGKPTELGVTRWLCYRPQR
jgi:DNA (cytosine-5)-methyltransferase 1